MFDFILDKSFFRKALVIAIPVALQNIINTSINLVDTLMVATLDSTAVAAVGLCNNVFTFWNTVSFGIISGGMILCSQFAGAKNESAIRRTYGLTIIFDFIGSMCFFLPSFFATDAVMRVLTNDPSLLEVGAGYLKIVCFMYPIQAITLTTLLILRSFGNVKITVFSSLITLLSNIIFNYLFINGNLGAPALGARGAAIATIISRLIEAVIIVSYLFITNSVLIKKFSDLISFFKPSFLVLYFRNVLVTMIDEIIYGLSSALYFIAYGRMGANQVSAISIVMVIYNLLLTFFIGFCSACSVILGIELGQNNIATAKKYAKYFIKLFFVLSTIISILTFFGKELLPLLYSNLGSEVLNYIDKCMYVVIFNIFAGTFSYLFLVGILRSGGDVKFTVVIDFISGFVVGVPLVFLSVLVWKLPIYIAFISVSLEEVVKTLLAYFRYRQNKWANNLVKNET